MAHCFTNAFGTTTCSNDDDAWSLWGRWVFLGGVLLLVLAIYLIAACFSARRRRRAGMRPYTGTQWTLSVNLPAYQSGETLPIYAPRGQKCQADNDGVNRALMAPSAVKNPERI
ncbi:hypothetical protein DOTSEDRAFT_39050 [Dothistroma septosporum NZE10]|uniref:Uncharacterized protein n=1 Tax=Dothistroma septosporum (strain NZE10 / CBS 128990) TaxID=675120 RepID=M2WIQ7_DOTSN|nr:hypothetical protein DOTSEDRAFT_39050 [Dothistroma septosporum NZE10]